VGIFRVARSIFLKSSMRLVREGDGEPMKRCLDVLLVSALLLVLWACGSGSSNTNTSSTTAGSGGSGSGSTSGTTGSTGGSSGGTTGGTGSGGSGGTTTPTPGTVQAVNHVIFMLNENRTFDTYFGMLNPYRLANNFNVGDDGITYNVDGIDDKLTTFTNQYNGKTFLPFKMTTACVDDMSSDWPASFEDVSNSFSTSRKITMKYFVQEAANYAKGCAAAGCGSGSLTDNPTQPGTRAMGYYDQDLLNYYYYMASQFAVSDRWFSPVASKSTPNRIATISGGTTQGLTNDPFASDHLSGSLAITTIFQELDQAKPAVSWKIYYGITQSGCVLPNSGSPACAGLPEVDLTYFTYGFKYLNASKPCGSAAAPTTVASGTAVGDPKNSYCIDPNHIAPITQYFVDVANGTLPNFAYIIPAYGHYDEHPGSGQSILAGQTQVSTIVNALMSSPSWKDSVFFFSYDEGGGPLEHVPPVPKHTNDFTDASLAITTDISSIAVNPDTFFPCPAPSTGPTVHCDLSSGWPGTSSTDAAAKQGFAAQLGFRLPNMIVSPFVRKHYVGHAPMDHTAVLKFVESRFIGPTAHLTNRDAVQPDLLDFFDFTNVPWATPPTPPTPVPDTAATCHPGTLGTSQ
jgi:phospholipase C